MDCEVYPRVGLGPFRLGMTQEEAEKPGTGWACLSPLTPFTWSMKKAVPDRTEYVGEYPDFVPWSGSDPTPMWRM